MENLVEKATKAGKVLGSTFVGTDKCEKWINKGYNFMTDDVVDMLNGGIVDPAKVTRCALQNAVSVASTLITTSHAIVS